MQRKKQGATQCTMGATGGERLTPIYVTLAMLSMVLSLTVAYLARPLNAATDHCLDINEPVHTLRDVRPGDVIPIVYQIANNCNEVIDLREVRPSCSCVEVSFDRSRLRPGERASIGVVFHAGDMPRPSIVKFALVYQLTKIESMAPKLGLALMSLEVTSVLPRERNTQ